MDSVLWDLEQAVRQAPTQLFVEATQRRLLFAADGRVNVELVGKPGMPPVTAESLAHRDITIPTLTVHSIWRHRVSAHINPIHLTQLAMALPPSVDLRAVLEPSLDEPSFGTDPADLFADYCGVQQYIDAGADGSGKTIGILDYKWDNLTEAQAAGAAPPDSRLDRQNFTWSTFEDDGFHGTACLESAYDHASGASYVAYKIANLTDVGQAVDHAISNDVDILSHSISYYNEGWADDSGDACAQADEAANAGILYFCSAGNRGRTHWQDTFLDSDGDGWHEWGSGGDETIDISIGNGGGGTYFMSFNTAGAGADYDVYLFDDSLNELDSGTDGTDNFEEFSWTNSTGSTMNAHLAIYHYSGATPEFEMFYNGTEGSSSNPQHQEFEGSTTSPSNTTDSRVISCGAAKYDNWPEENGATGLIQGYSSRGRSNSGMMLPDLIGPTGNWTVAYASPSKPNGAFGGTSCATPNLAGVAGCFWSAFPNMMASSVGSLLKDQARVYRDWGDSGDDITYGAGGAFLHEYAAGTIWVDRDFMDWVTVLGGVWDGSTVYGPFYRVEDAVSAMGTGGRMVFLGNSYPEPVTATKRFDVETIGSTATLGN
ncbi:MAG: S8 family serine peptidase [Planctomycetota bacterium]|nr:S8 family serine peptidase [Planctomycetota bacterium]